MAFILFTAMVKRGTSFLWDRSGMVARPIFFFVEIYLVELTNDSFSDIMYL